MTSALTVFSISELRQEAERELLRRRRDYPARVARKRMTKAKAEYRIMLMAAIVSSLREEEKAELLI